jgi:hypothetical protein
MYNNLSGRKHGTASMAAPLVFSSRTQLDIAISGVMKSLWEKIDGKLADQALSR